jgi:uncharacterized protein
VIMTSSPFHHGERQVQTRAGVRDVMERKGGAVIRDFMPDQHRAFFETLPFLVVSTADQQGQPWASMLFGSPGFLSSPNPSLLAIEALPAEGDPIAAGMRDGRPLGGLGIELPTRRRNRVNGRIETSESAQRIALRVQQSFGNCPKYIQARKWLPSFDGAAPKAPQVGDRLDDTSIELIARSDTFFIASRAAALEGDASRGLDVSHRGGLPGFVQILSDRQLAFPDYKGNLLFNTLGNILSDARVGLLFVDFAGGALLHIAGRAKIGWDVPSSLLRQGVERLVFVEVDQVVRRAQACPLTFQFVSYSPHLERPGTASGLGTGSPRDTGGMD